MTTHNRTNRTVFDSQREALSRSRNEHVLKTFASFQYEAPEEEVDPEKQPAFGFKDIVFEVETGIFKSKKIVRNASGYAKKGSILGVMDLQDLEKRH